MKQSLWKPSSSTTLSTPIGPSRDETISPFTSSRNLSRIGSLSEGTQPLRLQVKLLGHLGNQPLRLAVLGGLDGALDMFGW